MQRAVILFGGTFDPPHLGHLTMAQMAWEQTGCDAVWFMPSPDPPHKQTEFHVGYQVRVAMVERLIAAADPSGSRFVVSTIEAEMDGPSYTVDTIRLCKTRFPDLVFQFLIGSDSLAGLPTWHDAEALCDEIEFLVVERAEHPWERTYDESRRLLPNLRASHVAMPVLDVSSTWVRARLEQGKPVCGLVPDDVLQLFSSAPR